MKSFEARARRLAGHVNHQQLIRTRDPAHRAPRCAEFFRTAPRVRPYPVINNEDGAGAHDRRSSLVLLTRSSRKNSGHRGTARG
jgi:hypothetical protein